MTTQTPHIAYVVGAQKAGTSWLHGYLRRHPQCYSPVIKELNYFDFLHGNTYGKDLVTGWRQSQLSEAEARLKGDPENAALQQRCSVLRKIVAMHEMPTDEAYQGVLMDGYRGQPVIADVTPGYATVEAEGIARMRAMAPVTRFIYIMRDPVDRLWSALRMYYEYVNQQSPMPIEDFAANWQAILDPELIQLSDYAGTVSRLDAEVPEEDRLYLFYEDLFEEKTLGRITDFLGINARPGQPDNRVNVGQYRAMPEVYTRAAAEVLGPQYTFVAERFGGLPKAWAHNMEGAS